MFINKEYYNMIMVVVWAFVLFCAWKAHENASDEDKMLYRGVLGVGAVVMVCHLWCLWQWWSKEQANAVRSNGNKVANAVDDEGTD
jgi:hypothetical protein